MPIGSAFHPRTLPLASSLSFRDWAGYFAVSAFETHHEHEYNAIRNGCALIDISPLFKYHLHGPDALRLVDRLITRDASALAVGQVYYTPWCDDDGQVIDDGTVARLAADRVRWTAADPNLRWLLEHAHGLNVSVEDVTEQVAALALQGPSSARVLAAVSDIDVTRLKYFRAAAGSIAGVPVEVTRTGYTGDLGYEVWMPWARALEVWDAVVEAGRAHVLRPAGMLALDVARVEAGLLLTDVDFHSVRKASIASQMYSPYELGLGRLVQLDKASPFVGRAALAREHAAGHRRQIVGLEVRWTEVEAIYQSVGLPPAVPAAASRVAVPVYNDRRQVGKATSTAWSPTLKKLVALATIDRPHFAEGTELQMEITVEATRYTATATVVPTPFLKLALVQQHATRDRADNLRRGLLAVDRAAAAGAQVVCFAELAFEWFYPQRPADSTFRANSETLEGPIVSALQKKAAEHGVVIVANFFERDGLDTFDTSPVIDANGVVLGMTRMVHITDYACFHEQGYYTPGDTGAPVYDTRFGRIGVAICYDRHFPEYMRALALDGADLVVVPQAGTIGEFPDGLYEAEMRVTALQNGYHIALCNRVGAEDCVTFAGESFVCGPFGDVIARAPQGEDHILHAAIDPGSAYLAPARKLYLRHRRPELYAEWVARA